VLAQELTKERTAKRQAETRIKLLRKEVEKTETYVYLLELDSKRIR
jgi:hypothetical protein